MSLRDKILNAKDIQEELVKVPEWEVEILVRGMTGIDRNRILESCVKVNAKTKETKTDLVTLYPEVIICCSYDPQTKEKIFSPEDRDGLSKKNGKALDTVFKVAAKLSGLNEEMEEAEKNS